MQPNNILVSAINVYFKNHSKHFYLKSNKNTSLFPFTEDNWRVIQKYATEILAEYSKKQLAFQLEGKCDFHPRFSYTRSVSHVEYVKQQKRMSLKDGAEAICVCDILDEESPDDVFQDPQ